MTTRQLISLLTPTPQSIGAIAEATGVSRREVERACEEAAAAGLPLVAGARGVWLTSSADELRDYEARLRDRVRSQMRRIRGVRRARRDFEQPLTLWREVVA